MSKYNIWNKWGRLRTIVLGSCYNNGFFDCIENEKLRDSLNRIIKETNEDLDEYQRIMESYGVEVLRVEPPDYTFEDFIDNGLYEPNLNDLIPRPPLMARDTHLVIGDKLFSAIPKSRGRWDDNQEYAESIVDLLEEYDNDSGDMIFFPSHWSAIEPPSMTVVGKDLYVDLKTSLSHHKETIDTIQSYFPDIRINELSIGGHNDGCFHTVKEGAILSILDIQYYDETFPGWDVCFLEGEAWGKVQDFLTVKNKTRGKWWVEDGNYDDSFIDFIDGWLSNWVGYVEESVFDVNVVMLDENHMFCSNVDNPLVIEFCKKHDIEMIQIPWRHRFFWDGGLHCLTLDLVRDGGMEDYFPEREQSIQDKGFD